MNSETDLIELIEKYIIENNLDDALNELRIFFNNNNQDDLNDESILLLSRLKNIKGKANMGMAKYTDEEFNQIRYSTLVLKKSARKIIEKKNIKNNKSNITSIKEENENKSNLKIDKTKTASSLKKRTIFSKNTYKKILILLIIIALSLFFFTLLKNRFFNKKTDPTIEKQINAETYNEIENQTNNYLEKSEPKELNFTSNLFLYKQKNNQVGILASFNNLSPFAGTKPKVQIIIYGMKTDSIKHSQPMELMPSNEASKGGELFQTIDFSKYKIPITGMYTSSKNYAENILYPNDKLSLHLISKPYPSFKNHRYAIGQLDCLFKEGKRQTRYYIFDFINEKKSNIIFEASNNNIALVFKRYESLVSKN